MDATVVPVNARLIPVPISAAQTPGSPARKYPIPLASTAITAETSSSRRPAVRIIRSTAAVLIGRSEVFSGTRASLAGAVDGPPPTEAWGGDGHHGNDDRDHGANRRPDEHLAHREEDQGRCAAGDHERPHVHDRHRAAVGVPAVEQLV